MTKQQFNTLLEDDEFLAQLDMLRSDCDSSHETIDELMNDIKRLVSILDNHHLQVPADILNKISWDSELPFI